EADDIMVKGGEFGQLAVYLLGCAAGDSGQRCQKLAVADDASVELTAGGRQVALQPQSAPVHPRLLVVAVYNVEKIKNDATDHFGPSFICKSVRYTASCSSTRSVLKA